MFKVLIQPFYMLSALETMLFVCKSKRMLQTNKAAKTKILADVLFPR